MACSFDLNAEMQDLMRPARFKHVPDEVMAVRLKRRFCGRRSPTSQRTTAPATPAALLRLRRFVLLELQSLLLLLAKSAPGYNLEVGSGSV